MDERVFYFQDVIQAFIFYPSGRSIFSHEVNHYGGKYMVRVSQRITKHYSPKHVELRAIVRFDGMMAAVMDTGRCFIDEHIPVFIDQHFNRIDSWRFKVSYHR